jgi:uncharacterized membrane protein
VTFEEWMEGVVHGFEIVGVAILVAGSIAALAEYVLALARGRREGAFERVRQAIGRAILLGLEVLIIADIVLTITVDTTLESALTLGLVVLVRTFLSFSLEIELEGALPWRRTRRQTDRPIRDDNPGRVRL